MNKQDNVIDLCAIRKNKYPSRNEIVSHLESMLELLDPIHSDLAASLLEMLEANMLDVTRAADGEFLYALRKEESETGRSGTVQDIRAAAGYDGVAEEVREKSATDSDCERTH